MNGEINIILLGLVIVATGGTICLMCSPDCLDRVALNFRARARGMRAARLAYHTEWGASYVEDYRQKRRIEEAKMLMRELCSDEQGRITE